MFISRPALPPDSPIYEHHQVLWSYFPDVARGEQRPFLYRHLNGSGQVLMLSRLPPRCEAEPIQRHIEAGRVYPFDAMVAPRAMNDRDGKQTVKIYREPAEVRAWFGRRLKDAAEARFVRVEEVPRLTFRKGDRRRVISDRVRLRGALEVKDRAAFLEILAAGIGSGKCWGLGMIVLTDVMLALPQAVAA